ncbi:MAG: hypothetical protein JSW58_06020 [Candidatus Latescibacterota bacterium]|nr:MAG: hypothetical protein JSW58_06020 [Candidatus Latescibacterota bacterium]
MLKRLIKVLPVMLILVYPVWGNAAIIQESFQLSGFGGYLITPAVFDGAIFGGTLAPGTFIIDIDDVIWPVDDPGTPENERWDYVFANYFVYDNSVPGAEKWTAYFPPLPVQLPVVTWSFSHNGDRVAGIFQSLIVTIADSDSDGVVDQDEMNIQAISGNLVSHIEQSTGEYSGFCGGGSCNGTIEGYELTQPYVMTISGGSLILRDYSCPVATEYTSWGAVKEIYSE